MYVSKLSQGTWTSALSIIEVDIYHTITTRNKVSIIFLDNFVVRALKA